MDTSIEVVGRRIFTSGQHKIGVEVEQSWKNQVTERTGIIGEDMKEERHIWRLGMDRWLLVVQIQIIVMISTFHWCLKHGM